MPEASRRSTFPRVLLYVLLHNSMDKFEPQMLFALWSKLTTISMADALQKWRYSEGELKSKTLGEKQGSVGKDKVEDENEEAEVDVKTIQLKSGWLNRGR
jgi:hypothetical protein